MSTADPSFPHRVFRWFRGVFHAKPGFLLDKAWTALAIGVSVDAFDAYEARLSDALYIGIFADAGEPRWWKSRLYETLLPDSPERFTTSLCEAAKTALGINDEEASRCYLCGEKWPEVMGYVDEVAVDEKDTEPLHLRCSRVHPFASPLPFYEERRVMLED